MNAMFTIYRLLVHSVISAVCEYLGGGEDSLRRTVVLAIPSNTTQDTGYINMQKKYSETINKINIYDLENCVEKVKSLM